MIVLLVVVVVIGGQGTWSRCDTFADGRDFCGANAGAGGWLAATNAGNNDGESCNDHSDVMSKFKFVHTASAAEASHRPGSQSGSGVQCDGQTHLYFAIFRQVRVPS